MGNILNKQRQMGGNDDSQPAPPPEPEKTVKEMVTEAKKGINDMIRGFKRETMRIEMDAKRIKKDLEKAVKKGEPRTTQKIYASNYLKKQQMINKYKSLEAKMEGTKISLANIQTTAQLTDTMQIMNRANEAIDVNNIQKTVTQFSMAMEKQNIIGEMIEDATEMDDMEVEDQAADDLIDNIASGNKGKTTTLIGQEDDTFADDLKGLKD